MKNNEMIKYKESFIYKIKSFLKKILEGKSIVIYKKNWLIRK